MTATGDWRVGIDVGGTFTDVVAFRAGTGETRTAKVGSRTDDPVAGLLAALDAVGLAWIHVADLVHGTTLITNAVIEDRLARVALIATRGFADTLAIGRQNRRYLYRLDLAPKETPLVPVERRLEVEERLGPDGDVVTPLSDGAIEDVVRRLADCRAEAVAVSLLHAYANPEHEERLADAVCRVVPRVALSHRVNPEAREYERTATTALSAGVMPLAADYLEALEARRPAASRLHLFHSAGGMGAPDVLAELPLGLALSGPAAGVAAAARVATELGIDTAISLDMGGTTTDVCLIVDGRAEIGSDRRIGERSLRQPMVAIETIGAGGGSIARLDYGVLRVGPESAGADPGPACYGRGGEAPTVTDANLVLGYLDAGRPLGDGLRIDAKAARTALDPLARGLGADPQEAALGVVRVANATMTRALGRVTVDRGVDGRRSTLVAFGGAGPMHAVELARAFGIARVVVPALSGGFSALGCADAELGYAQQQTVRMASTAWDRERLDRVRAALEERLSRPLRAAGHGVGDLRCERVAAVRYGGQSYAVEVADPDLDDPDGLGAAFRERHRLLYGFATDEPWELVALRYRVSVPADGRVATLAASASGRVEPTSVRPCRFDGAGSLPTPRYDRDGLEEGRPLSGPAVVEDRWSTVVVPPGATLRADADGHLHIDVGSAP